MISIDELTLLIQYPILNIYHYGSYVYGIGTSKSDIDLIVICDSDEFDEKQILTESYSINIYSKTKFQSMLDEHKIDALECYFLPENMKIQENWKLEFQLDLQKLRHSISHISSNSWVKAKKKFEVEHDYYIGKKSLFHCLRILLFGHQIAIQKKILDYGEANSFWIELMGMSSINWIDYKNIYQPIYNKLHSEFKKVAPKHE